MRIAPKPKQGQEVSLDSLLKTQNAPVPTPGTIPGPAGGVLLDFGDYWRLGPISLRGDHYIYDLKKGFLEDRAQRTIKEWAEYSAQAFNKKEFVAASADVLFAIIDFLHQHLTNPQHGQIACDAWDYLGNIYKAEYGDDPMLLTLCSYKSNPPSDQVTHDLGIPTIYRVEGRLRGIDGGLGLSLDKDDYTRITLGCQDAVHVNQVLSELTGQPPEIPSNEQIPDEGEFPFMIWTHPCNLQLDPKWELGLPGPAIGVAQRKRF